MSTRRDTIKLLRERREKLCAELGAVKTRIDEVDGLLRSLGDSPPPAEIAPTERRARRGNLKEVVLSMVEEAGEAGLSSHGAVTWARDRSGVELQPASVSSLLSRLKADGVLFFDGSRYRLKRYAGPRNPTREAV